MGDSDTTTVSRHNSNSNMDRRSNTSGSRHQAAVQMNSQEEDQEKDFDLKYGAEHVIKLFVPVTLCMLVVILTLSNVQFYNTKDVYLIYTPFNETSSDTFTKSWNAVANSLILICVVITMTTVLILLYKYNFYKVIAVWLLFSTVMLMFIFAYLFFEEILRTLNIPVDIFTILIFIWNFGVFGLLCIHWRGPMKVQQAYLIFIAALMALVFIKYMPEWTTWVVLFVISVWDLVAVLSPRGPLRILVETAQERNEAIFPSLIYSAVAYKVAVLISEGEPEQVENNSSPSTEREILVVGISDSDQGESSQCSNAETSRETFTSYNATDASVPRPVLESRNYRNPEDEVIVRRPRTTGHQPPTNESATEEGVKLGLGDFIFYSVLVGKASSYGDWNTTLACFVAILIGLCLTLLLLAIFKKALPALPISIFFGLFFYFITRIIVKPFADMLASDQIFI